MRPPSPLLRNVCLLVVCQIAVLSLWFSAAAVLPALAAAHQLDAATLAPLSAATQIGFALGALLFGAVGIPDRFDPRRLFASCAVLAAACNLLLLVLAPDGTAALLSRLAIGLLMAGIYPVGLKIAVGWSIRRRGLITSLLVGALTVGSASPHLIALLGGTDWQRTLLLTSALAASGGLAMLATHLGPYHQRAARFDAGALRMVAASAPLRRAFLGYYGHMWELYAFWGWVAVFLFEAAAATGLAAPGAFASAIAFTAMALGGVACVPAGWLADRHGKQTVARWALRASALAGAAAALSFNGPLWLFSAVVVLWGLSIIPDSAQFSALVADHAPADKVGSLLTLQTASGFALSFVTVQLLPVVAQAEGWQTAFAMLVLGPLLGLLALRGGEAPSGPSRPVSRPA